MDDNLKSGGDEAIVFWLIESLGKLDLLRAIREGTEDSGLQ